MKKTLASLFLIWWGWPLFVWLGLGLPVLALGTFLGYTIGIAIVSGYYWIMGLRE